MTLTNYWWYIIWMLIGGGFLAVLFPKQKILVIGERSERWSIVAAILLAFPYTLAAAGRGDNFGDTYPYRKAFFDAPSSLNQLPTYLDTISKDKGFSTLTVVLKSVFGNSDVIYFFIIAAIQVMRV